MDDILRSVQQQDGQCSPGTEILQAGTVDRVGYYFHQPVSYFRRSKHRSSHSMSTSRVYTGKEWAKRTRTDMQQYECQRRLFNEKRKTDFCVGGASARAAAASDDLTRVQHMPTIMIVSAHWNIRPSPPKY